MAGATLTVSLTGDDLDARFARLAALAAETTPIMKAIGAGIRDTTQARFDRAQDPEGTPWKGWSPAYAKVTRSSGLLRASAMRGGLMGSITFQANAHSVRVGSNKVYAAVHQFGATIVPRRGRFLIFRLGARVVFAKKVTLPARPYLGFGPAERQVVEDALTSALGQILRGRGGA
jgi:phage virion morphogenesis protein